MNWHYFLWVPLAVLYNFAACYISVKYNHENFWKMYLYLELVGFLPIWAMAAYYSRRLVFDGMLYDMILVTTSPMILAYFGQTVSFGMLNWIGIGICIMGLFLIRIPS